MANDHRKNQSKPDRDKPGEQDMDREQQSGRGHTESPDPSKGELDDEIDDESDDLGDEDVVDENRITQRNPAQRGRDAASAK